MADGISSATEVFMLCPVVVMDIKTTSEMKTQYKWIKVPNESIYKVGYDNGGFIHIATCSSKSWAEYIVNALNEAG
jgi:hypothetical protein